MEQASLLVMRFGHNHPAMNERTASESNTKSPHVLSSFMGTAAGDAISLWIRKPSVAGQQVSEANVSDN